MANRERGEVAFDALGQSWTLKLGTNAMCEIEDATGKTFSEVGELMGDQKRVTIKLMRTVFWGALREQHEDVTIKQAGAVIDDIGMQEAGRLIGEAFQAAMPEQKEGAARPPKAAA
ncbi:hypothetical protein [Mesorhizobium sp. SP-1A]|uniref:hypothetical protein n=1 Tax=Mesorhizobium sp. SP-1A TaxID=3077840 RepID=UPI0028F72D44|nr:hypothetical protein [Mesorhizobium sp. SP-1A]